MCEVFRATGIVCFDYNAEMDELTAVSAMGERVIADFSKGEYGPLVRAVLSSDANSGSIAIKCGRVWYMRAPTGANVPRKCVGALFPFDGRAESDLDRTSDMAYTGICDEDRRRFERYRLLGEDASVVTFDYDPKADALVYSMFAGCGARVESTVRGYLENLTANGRVAPESREICRANMLHALRAPMSGSFEYRANFFGEGYRWYRLRYVSAADADGCVYRVVGCADEIEKEMADRADLMKGALTDGVTGLYNRRTAQRLIELALTEPVVQRYDALFVIDIDDFKRINDTRGHLQGDAALLQVANVIRAVFREDDIKGRYGGDEFIIYMRAFSDPALPGVVARRLMNRLAVNRCEVSCSVGVALVSEKAQFDDVFARADGALYRAKNASKSCFAMSRE
jgi:diguanylate cyclase (GGDEF)-like protein